MSQQRKPLLTLTEATKLYGAERVKFPRPRFVDEGFCEWCGQPIENRRRKSCCCEDHSEKFNIATSPVYYANQGSAGGYRGHILRRDKFTCQVCGEFHVKYSEYGIPLPTTDGQLDVHHIKPVAEGGTDAPDNLMTVCRTCHKKITAEWQKEIKQKESDIDLFGQEVLSERDKRRDNEPRQILEGYYRRKNHQHNMDRQSWMLCCILEGRQ